MLAGGCAVAADLDDGHALLDLPCVERRCRVFHGPAHYAHIFQITRLGAAVPALQDTVVGQTDSEVRGLVVAVWAMAVRAGQTIGPLAAAAMLAAGDATLAFTSAGLLAALPAAAYGAVALRTARRGNTPTSEDLAPDTTRST